MSDLFGRSLNRSPPAVAGWIKRQLRDGEELGVVIVYEDDFRALSHTIRHMRGAYYLTDWHSVDAGRFATFSAAMTAGFEASAEALEHGL